MSQGNPSGRYVRAAAALVAERIHAEGWNGRDKNLEAYAESLCVMLAARLKTRLRGLTGGSVALWETMPGRTVGEVLALLAEAEKEGGK